MGKTNEIKEKLEKVFLTRIADRYLFNTVIRTRRCNVCGTLITAGELFLMGKYPGSWMEYNKNYCMVCAVKKLEEVIETANERVKLAQEALEMVKQYLNEHKEIKARQTMFTFVKGNRTV